jgi:hypothetical protein
MAKRRPIAGHTQETVLALIHATLHAQRRAPAQTAAIPAARRHAAAPVRTVAMLARSA